MDPIVLGTTKDLWDGKREIYGEKGKITARIGWGGKEEMGIGGERRRGEGGEGSGRRGEEGEGLGIRGGELVVVSGNN